MLNEIRLYLCEVLLSLILHIVPVKTDNGKSLVDLIHKYFKNILNDKP